jgi:transcriptional regulator with XRE-family HTH domain
MFGDKLKQLRKDKGITQQQLAQLMNVGRSTIAGYETKRVQPDYEKLTWLSSYFGVSIEDLLDVKGNNKNENTHSDKDTDSDPMKHSYKLSEEEKSIVTYYRNLNNLNKDIAKGYLANLCKEQNVNYTDDKNTL